MTSVKEILEGPGTRSVEDVHHVRLMALLKDMVRELGPVEAAEALGIDRKTVWRGLSAGRLSPRLADALERLLLSESVADAARQLERIEALEQVVGELTEDMKGLAEEVRGEIEALRERDSHGAAKSGVRWSGLDALRRRAMATPVHTERTGGRRGKRAVERMLDPRVVTGYYAPGDEEVYGEAWPLVDDWRALELRREIGTKLDRARTRERIMALEIALIDDHGLTLPPASSPMHPSEKRSHLGWRRRALVDLQRERGRLKTLGRVRRVLTFGLWSQ